MTPQKLQGIANYLRDKIKNTKFENHVFLVGGCVRDYLLGDNVNDIDIAVDLPNGGVEFANWITKEELCYKPDYNPCTVGRMDTCRFYLSTKEDLKYVVFDCCQTRKNPSYSLPEGSKVSENLGTILQDGNLRDLTVNAMFLDVSSMAITDVCHGIDDMQDKILRTPNLPSVTFKDDPLRMMRVIRFATKYGWGIEKDTWLGIVEHHNLITSVSVERFKDELNQILLSPCPSVGLKKLMASGMLYDMIPQLYNLNHVGESLNVKIPFNIWEKTLEEVDETEPRLINRLAALFRCVGKATAVKYIEGNIKFYGYETISVNVTSAILRTLKYPNHIIESVALCIKYHSYFSNYLVHGLQPSKKTVRKFLTEVGDWKPNVLDLIRAVAIVENITAFNNFTDLKCIISETEAELDYTNFKIPITGDEIMKSLNLSPSPLIGKIIDHLKDKYLDDPSLTKEELLQMAEDYKLSIVSFE